MKRKAENFYLAVNHVPEILGLTYTERPEEYNMTFISYFYEKEKVAYIFDGALHIKEIPKGGNITILSQPGIPSEIDMVLLNFEHFYITHIPQSIHANVLVLPEASEYQDIRTTPFFYHIAPPNMIRVFLWNVRNLTIYNRPTVLTGVSVIRSREIMKYYNLDAKRYEIIHISDIEWA